MKEIFKLNNFQKSQKEIIETEMINGNEQFLENDEAHEDFIYDYYEKFLNNIEDDEYSKKIWEDWQDKFVVNPNNFFKIENYQELGKLDPADRLAQFFHSTRSLYVTPDMVDEYFKQFPDDAEVAYFMWRDNEGHPKTNAMFEFFGTCAKVIATKDKNPRRDKRLEQYLEIAERKNLAPQVLIGNYEENGKLLQDIFKKFGKSADGLLNAFSEAAELMRTGDHFIDAKQIFTPDFEKIKEEDKAEFLRLAIIQFHQALVFDEVWNSAFTKDLVEMKKDNKNKVWFNSELERKLAMPDVAHSYTFKTYQPLQAFSLNQEYFDIDMNRTADQGGFIEEYPFHRLLLSSIDRLSKMDSDKDKNTDLLVEFWDKNRNPIFANAVADALSKQNSNRAAGKLLEAIRNEPEDKRALAAILYRLELGQIGISSEGAKYLEKMYDLGLYNNPDYHISRLTPNGEVGIFNEEKELIKYFELGDLTSEEKKIKAQVLDITYDTLFIGPESESDDERAKRLKYLEDFKKHYYDLAQDKIFKQTDIRLNNLNFREQGWFLHLLKESSNEESDRILEFTKKYHEAGLKTFLVMEYGEENIDKLLILGEKGNESENDFLFRQFAEIVNQAESIDQRVNQLMTEVGNQDFFDKKIFENLIRQGKNYLLAAADIKEKGEGVIHFDGQFIEARDISTIMTLMEKIKKEMIIFLQTVNDWETLKNHGMPIIDKYLFDSKNIEKIKNTEINVFIDGSDDFKQEWHERLSEEKNINIQEDFNYLLYLKDKKKNSLPDVLLNEIDGGTSYRVQIVNMNNSILKQKELNTPNKKEIDRINNLIKVQPITIGVSKDNFSEYSVVRKQGDYSKILNTLYDPHNNETPERHKLYHMQDYIINNSFGAYNSVYLLRDAVYNKKNKPDIQFDQANLKAYEEETFTKQEHDYEINRSNPDTLKLIEEKTADTTEALRHLFQRIDENDYQSVLDLGTGEGRIGIPLAMKGIKVLGVDQVEKELASIKQRVVKEVGQTNERGYSWRHLQKLIEQETVKESELIFDEQQVLENYQTKQGNFFELDKVLPEKDEKFDMVTFTWHTFCETGTIDNQRDVLVDVYDRLNPGGMVYIEIPDRTVGAYKYALNENIKHHPNEPVGVSRDSTCLRPGVACVYDEKATPRFFPGRDELRNLLRVIGYTDVELDTYLITSHDKDGKEYLEVKELVVTAKKPKEQATVKEMSVEKKKTKVLATKKKKGLPRKAA